MRKPDIHQPRTLIFRPGEEVNIDILSRARRASTKLKLYRGKGTSKSSSRSLIVRLPKETLKGVLVELDICFASEWDKLHRQGRIDVLFESSEGTKSEHLIVPGPSNGRWTYRLLTVNPGMRVGVCTERTCKSRMVPVQFVTATKPCRVCGKKKVVSIPMPSKELAIKR